MAKNRAAFDQGRARVALTRFAAAWRIGRAARSRNMEFGCHFALALFALAGGKRSLAVPLLRKTMRSGLANRRLWTPRNFTPVVVAALENGMEAERARALVRNRGLAPPQDALLVENWPFPVRIYTLGRFAVLVDGKPLEFSGKAQRKPLDLLMALVAFGGRDVGEGQLTEALWPDAEGDAAHLACAAALHRLRKLLACDDAIGLQRGQFSLNPHHVWVDVWAFERWLAADQGETGAYRDALDKAIALYQGPFLGKDADQNWAIPMRERLRAKFLRRLAESGRALFEAGEFGSAIAVFERGLNADPLVEEFYRDLMLCYRALDRRAEAIGVYQRCQKTLAATLGVAPAQGTVALYRAIRA